MFLTRRAVLASLVFLVALGGAPAADPQPVQILFIGNSYTFVNDLPKMLDELAKAGNQRPLAIGRELKGGYSLEKHWGDGKAAPKIAEKKWDVVVLQDHSLGPITNRKALGEYATKFDQDVRKQGAKTLFYLTWARQDKPENQAVLTKGYLDVAKELKAAVAPVGVAWEMALKADDKLVLHQADKSHPTKTGTYLGACVFYGALFNKSPEGLPGKPADLSDAEARKLQSIAWKAVQETAAK